ncbi:hypothetical protein HY095_04980 [Candidatus Micrarchaeota archaeon]|nr:hypothetical protein [Candidatus Micrarchaeota archaeon]
MGCLTALAIVAGVISFAAAATLYGTVFDSELRPLPALVSINSQPAQTVGATNGSYALEVPQGRFTISVFGVENPNGLRENRTLTVPDPNGKYELDFILLSNATDGNGLSQALSELSEISPLPRQPVDAQAIDGPAVREWDWRTAALFLFLLAAAAAAYFHWKGNAGNNYAKREGATDGLRAQTDENPEDSADSMERKQAQMAAQSPTAAQNELPATPPEALLAEEREVLEQLALSGGILTQKDLRKRLPYGEARVSLLLSALEKQGKIRRIKQGRGNIIKRMG